MRILKVTVRNYRLHRELTIDLDRERTLIGGPNETGKSTLVEAIHRALFLRAKGASTYHRAMESTVHGGKPEVEVIFEATGTTYRLHKRFSGNSGTTTLTPERGTALSGDAAEQELARILKVDQGANNSTSSQQWAHLWVWQGSSGADPASHANEQKDALLQRLGQSGGAAVLMQSATDARVAETFAAERDVIFHQRGEPKSTSELGKASAAAVEARSALNQAQERFDRVQQAMASHAQACSALVELRGTLAKLESQRQGITARQGQLHELRQHEATETASAQSARSAHETLQKAEVAIRDLRARIRSASECLTPQEAELERLTNASEAARHVAEDTLRAYDAATDEVRVARQEHELAVACVALLEKRHALAQLNERAEAAKKIECEIAELRTSLARLPAIEPAQVKQLRRLEEARATATAALEAMAAGIEIVESDQAITLADQPLIAGKLHIISEDSELRIGDGTRIRIRPGGGTSLAQARRTAQEARAQLQALLDQLQVADASSAQDIAQRRADLQARISAGANRLKDLDAESIASQLETARTEEVATVNDIARRATALNRPAPEQTDVTRARAMVTAAAARLHESELAERKARTSRDAAARALTTATEALTRSRAAADSARRALHDLEAQVRLLVDQHGDDATRQSRLAEACAASEKASAQLAATRQKIAELQPDLLAADSSRLDRALAEAKRTQQDATTQQAVAESTLRNDGSMDPQADLETARARVAAVEDRLASLTTHARAIRLLDDLFCAEQQALADQFTRPLVDKVSGYLECLFGAGARMEIQFKDQQFGPPQLIRPAVGHGAIEFDALSGGTKEQLAAAMRLAMAEVLAADHDGSLPIIFDDAFAFADPDRVQILQRMLDLAATRGLQLIVLTCTPSDYAALGARSILLASPSVRPPDRPTVPTSGSPDLLSPISHLPDSLPVTDTLRDQFLDALRARGGSSGNGSLRDVLGWDESTYDSVKHDLTASRCVSPRKGRGGSVALPSPTD